jgi:hypothetical protein
MKARKQLAIVKPDDDYRRRLCDLYLKGSSVDPAIARLIAQHPDFRRSLALSCRAVVAESAGIRRSPG